MKKLEDYVITIPDFPEEGIMFRDITGILKEPEGIQLAEDQLMEKLDGVEFDAIVGLESRGFLFGMPMAYEMNKPFIPIRKKGKLPRETVDRTYDLEYGTATIEVHKEDVFEGERLVLVDDLLATGGTMEAACKLVESLGGKVVKVLFLLELEGLNGRAKLEDYDVESIVKYEGK
ncbi:MAG: adenine phosphoribosyltransferase [Lachnospiraceae bacterium]|nr:adenine phosphoribosyltransferase [Lachnospiraceae bacterium]